MRIDDSLTPYDGKFLVHGTHPAGHRRGFPGLRRRHLRSLTWSARTAGTNPRNTRRSCRCGLNNSDGGAVIVDGVAEGYLASSYLAKVAG